ncbi:MAG: hypothetical protein ACRDNJ_09020 [Solirubrobacteraceae bacterium]
MGFPRRMRFGHRPFVAALLASVLALTLAAVAAAHVTHWSHLRRVTVTVANGSLPPPYGRPHTRRFQTATQLRQVTRALNAARIAPGPSKPAVGGCAGGYTVRITIVPAHGARIRLHGYRCAGTTSGTIAGHLPRFLRAIHLPVP